PLPAAPRAATGDSAALALGAFSPTASAEGQLRSIVSRAGARSRAVSMSMSTSSKEEEAPTPPGSHSSRLRASSLRSLALPWPEVKHRHTNAHMNAHERAQSNVLYDIDNDDEESGDDVETEAFWPRRHHHHSQPHNPPPSNQAAQRTVPFINRTPSPSTANVTTTPDSRPRTQSAFAPAPAGLPLNPNSHPHPPSRLGPSADARKPKRLSHVRAFTEPSLSAFSRNNTNAIVNANTNAGKLPFSSTSARPLRSFIGPPRSKGRANSVNSGLPGARSPHTISSAIASANDSP
ncbi:hypothetical protein EW145_g8627, partial [Phellinidium pouzarii]